MTARVCGRQREGGFQPGADKNGGALLVVCRRSEAVIWARNTSPQDFTLKTQKRAALCVREIRGGRKIERREQNEKLEIDLIL